MEEPQPPNVLLMFPALPVLCWKRSLGLSQPPKGLVDLSPGPFPLSVCVRVGTAPVRSREKHCGLSLQRRGEARRGHRPSTGAGHWPHQACPWAGNYVPS